MIAKSMIEEIRDESDRSSRGNVDELEARLELFISGKAANPSHLPHHSDHIVGPTQVKLEGQQRSHGKEHIGIDHSSVA